MADAEVSRLLAQSMAAHNRAKAERKGKRPAQALETLREAKRLRLEAHALDPEHTAPAWADEQGKTSVGRDTHTSLLAFYAEQGL